jgi:hypothetical protein
MYNKKYIRIYRKYEKESGKESLRGTIFTWIYILGSLFLMFFIAYLISKKRGAW